MSTMAKTHSSLLKVNQDDADRVNDRLPTRLTAKDVQQYPELVKLLMTLSHQLTVNGTSVGTDQDLTEAQETLKASKLRWLQYHILYHELEELLLEQDIQALDLNQSHANQQFYKVVKDGLRTAEICDYQECDPDPTSQATLLGLTKEEIQNKNPNQKHLQSIQQQLIPEVESRLRKKCENLVNFHDTSASTDASGDAKFTFARASHLPATLETEKQETLQQKQGLKRDKRNREKHFWSYYETLMDCLETLEKLITRHKLHSKAEEDTVISKWLVSRCDAMCQKLRLLELQVLCDTYYAETVDALAKVRHHLNSAIRETKHELENTTHALQAYESVGLGFDKLVKDYTRIKDEVENKKWALREFKHSIEKEGT